MGFKNLSSVAGFPSDLVSMNLRQDSSDPVVVQ